MSTYLADDPEGAGITYSLVMDPVPDPDGDSDTNDAITVDDIADRARFSINSLDGTLSFKSSPNFEKPMDALDADAAMTSDQHRTTCTR